MIRSNYRGIRVSEAKTKAEEPEFNSEEFINALKKSRPNWSVADEMNAAIEEADFETAGQLLAVTSEIQGVVTKPNKLYVFSENDLEGDLKNQFKKFFKLLNSAKDKKKVGNFKVATIDGNKIAFIAGDIKSICLGF